MFAYHKSLAVMLLLLVSFMQQTYAAEYRLESGERLLESVCAEKNTTSSPTACVKTFLFANSEWFKKQYGYEWKSIKDVRISAARHLWSNHPYQLPNEILTTDRDASTDTVTTPTQEKVVTVVDIPAQETSSESPSKALADTTASSVTIQTTQSPQQESAASAEQTVNTDSRTHHENWTNAHGSVAKNFREEDVTVQTTVTERPIPQIPTHSAVLSYAKEISNTASEEDLPSIAKDTATKTRQALCANSLNSNESPLTLLVIVEFLLLLLFVVLFAREYKKKKMLLSSLKVLQERLSSVEALFCNNTKNPAVPNGNRSPFRPDAEKIKQ